jgi:hypothetical protein
MSGNTPRALGLREYNHQHAQPVPVEKRWRHTGDQLRTGSQASHLFWHLTIPTTIRGNKQETMFTKYLSYVRPDSSEHDSIASSSPLIEWQRHQRTLMPSSKQVGHTSEVGSPNSHRNRDWHLRDPHTIAWTVWRRLEWWRLSPKYSCEPIHY